jgi:hypothetical protein
MFFPASVLIFGFGTLKNPLAELPAGDCVSLLISLAD